MRPQPERIEKGLWWDRAWKLVEGCSPVSEGCLNCWSAREAHMRAKQRNVLIKSQYIGLTADDGKWNGQIRLMEKNLDLPLRVKKPQVWAVWNDLFHESVPFEFVFKAWLTMVSVSCFKHRFLILTKRPERMLEFYQWTQERIMRGICGVEFERNHIWLGVTAENQEQADKRIPILLQVPAAVRFVSVEPVLGPVSLRWLAAWNGKALNPNSLKTNEYDGLRCLDLIICGAESGPNRRLIGIDAIRNLRDQCVAAGKSFFLKQMEINGQLVKMPELDGQRWAQWPERSQ